VFLPLIGEHATAAQTVEVLGPILLPPLIGFFLALRKGAGHGAGKAFELLIRELFIRLHYPFTSQPIN